MSRGVPDPDPCGRNKIKSRGFCDEAYELGVWYGLAAVLIGLGDLDRCRVRMRGAFSRPPRGRLHFGKEDQKDRLRGMEIIAHLPVAAVVAICCDPRRPDSARGRCMSTLLWGVHGQIDHLSLESRSPRENLRDAVIIRGQGPRCCGPVRYDFVPALDDPLLWIADAIAGAVFQAQVRARSEYLDLLVPTQVRTCDA